MTRRVWDDFLSEEDRAHVEMHPARPKGVGANPVLLLVDLYRGAFGDKPEPLLTAVQTWPSSCGLAGWAALPHIQRLLAAGREHAIPVIHVTSTDAIAPWRGRRGPASATSSPEALDRMSRRFDIVDEVRPVDGEVVLHKAGPSAFWGTPLLGQLTALHADTVIVAGESTSGCVRATVVDGASYRLKMMVVEECVFDRHKASHAINLFDMQQKYADVVSVDEAISYMARIQAGRDLGQRTSIAS